MKSAGLSGVDVRAFGRRGELGHIDRAEAFLVAVKASAP
ncbi:hypothetical protein SAMN04490220_2088 [Rhodococcus jostii]|uniref:Uncharacterized protein n=1 Tax=Rhodococcus jostii TaxID=132919 RepID=A0A1H4TWY7_RHOJO|nr:hypothetical protein SAMN04490220_2088 [Rhodococcus jostii]